MRIVPKSTEPASIWHRLTRGIGSEGAVENAAEAMQRTGLNVESQDVANRINESSKRRSGTERERNRRDHPARQEPQTA